MHHREVLLSALKYPKAGAALLENDVEFAALVIWLENTKVSQFRAVDPTPQALHARRISVLNSSCKSPSIDADTSV